MSRTAAAASSLHGAEPGSVPTKRGRVPAAVRTWSGLVLPAFAPPPAVRKAFPPAPLPAGRDDVFPDPDDPRRLATLLAVTAAANAEAPLAHAFEAGLRTICGFAGWPAARAVRLAPAEVLACHAADLTLLESIAGPDSGPPVSAPALRAHTDRYPVWSRIRRGGADAALSRPRAAGLRTVLAVPVPVGGSVDAVLEFFSSDVEAPPDALVELARDAALQLGFRLGREVRVQAAAASRAESGPPDLARGEPAVVAQSVQLRSENARRRAELLAYASQLLDASFEYLDGGSAPILGNLVDLLVPTVCDFCRIDLLREDGTLERSALASNGARSMSPEPEWADDPALDAAVIRGVAASGRPVLLSAPTRAELAAELGEPREHSRLPRDLRSIVIAPLTARGRTSGVLTLGMIDSGRVFDSEDRVMAQDLALRVALALDNARLYRKSVAAGRWRDEVLATVSHDLRTPLSVVDMSAQALLQVYACGEEHASERKQFAIIRNAARQMRRLADDLLDAVKAEAGQLRVHAVPVQAAELVLEAVEMHSGPAAERDVELKVRLPRETAMVAADRDRVRQVLTNLLENALRFTARGGSITLAGVSRGAGVEFSVSDTGIGIGRDLLPHVFDRFRRGERIESKGAGLGLAIARAIVEAHGGRIWAESELGVGTTFTFNLPLAAESVTPPSC
jgi:signal transduction histidine kinase